MRKSYFIIGILSFTYLCHAQTLESWQYVQIDDTKSKWGDYADPDWLRYFGVAGGDVNGDGLSDIVSGRWIYLNQGSLSGEWKKVDMGRNIDGILVMDVDGDRYMDIIGQALPNLYWIEAENASGYDWKIVKIGEVPATSHVNSQGFTQAQIFEGDKEEFVIAGNGNIYLFRVPEDPENDSWGGNLICKNTSDEGIGLGDIDGDGDLDLAAGRRPPGEDEPKIAVWFENPGSDEVPWKDTEIGRTEHPADRFGLEDFDGDGNLELLVCEERWPGEQPDANIYYFEKEIDKSSWNRKLITTQYSSNNLDIADMNGDKLPDFITSEHKGSSLDLQLWINNGKGGFKKLILDSGKESHLGTQLYDMDGDGDLDIISAGWDQHQFVHLWINNP